MVEFNREKNEEFLISFDKGSYISLEYHYTEHMIIQGYFWGLGSADLLNIFQKVGGDHQQLFELIMECYQEEGELAGFSGNKNHDISLIFTQHAVYVLFQLNRLAEIEKKKILKLIRYISFLQKIDGSFQGDKYGEVDTRFSYCALATLSLLSLHLGLELSTLCQEYQIDLSKAVKFVLSCQNFDGGFGGVPSGESHSAYTWTCVAFLGLTKSLDKLSSSRKEDLIYWLSQRQCDSGGFNGRPEKQADVCYSWWVLASLEILGNTSWIDKPKLIHFINCCQDPKGGISDRPDNVGDVFHTFFGIAALSLLDPSELNGASNEICPQSALPKRLLLQKQ